VTQDSVSAVRLTEAQEDEIARGLVARARSEGAELVGPDGLLSGPGPQLGHHGDVRHELHPSRTAL